MDNKFLKVLYLSHSAELAGGAEKCLYTLLKHLDREKIEPVVVFPVDGPFKDAVEQLQITTHVSPMEWWVETECGIPFHDDAFLERVRKIGEILENEQPDIVQTNSSVIWEGAVAAHLQNVRHVWHVHEILEGHPSLTAVLPLPLFYRVMAIFSDRVVTVSDTERRVLARRVSPEILTTIYNGVEPDQVGAEAADSLRTELNIPPDTVVALTLASLARYKGIDTLLDAAVLAVSHNDAIRFVLAGSGTEEAIDILNSKIARLGLEGIVNFLGFRPDARALMHDSDFVVIPSEYESFSLVTAEAMAAGKPVITTDCGGPSELVVDGGTGYVVPANDPPALYTAMLRMSADAHQMRTMGEKGRERYYQHYTAESNVEKFLLLYRELMATSKRKLFSLDDNAMLLDLCDAYQLHMDKVKLLAEQERKYQELSSYAEMLRQSNKYAEEQLNIKDIQLHNERLRVMESEKKIESLFNSLSWRITRPLRALHSIMTGATFSLNHQGIDNAISVTTSFSDNRSDAFLLDVVRRGKGDSYDVVVFSVIDWHFRFQRPQQLAKQLASLGHRVFYLSTEFIYEWHDPGFRVIDSPCSNVFVVQINCRPPHPNIYRDSIPAEQVSFLAESLLQLKSILGIDKMISLVNLPFWRPVVDVLPSDMVVYDCMDHHAGFSTNTSAMLDEETLLLHSANLVITSSQRLSDIVGSEVPNIIIRNGAEVDFFSNRPKLLEFKSERPVVGYYGAISDWFDMELVIAAAKTFPGWDFVLVGSTFGCDVNRALQIPNIKLTGEVPYASLPGYLYAFDVCMIPFLLTELTLCTNPVKVYEYLSAGKPVVATAMPELQLISDIVHVADSKEDFMEKLKVAMEEHSDRLLSKKRSEWALQHDWAARAEQLELEIRYRFEMKGCKQ